MVVPAVVLQAVTALAGPLPGLRLVCPIDTLMEVATEVATSRHRTGNTGAVTGDNDGPPTTTTTESRGTTFRKLEWYPDSVSCLAHAAIYDNFLFDESLTVTITITSLAPFSV